MKRVLKGTAVTELVEQFSRRILSVSRHRELGRFQWSALRFYSGSYKKARTIHDFAAAHSVSPRRALQIVDQLRRKRLLKSCKSPALARVDGIEITAAGAKLLRRDPQALIKAALTILSASERRALLTALKRASTALSRPANRITQLCLFIGTGMLGYAGGKGQQTQNTLAQSAHEMLSRLV
jgi:DNA-binding MarR family transcriptional regulator